jgi:hypothetical protein
MELELEPRELEPGLKLGTGLGEVEVAPLTFPYA